MKNTGKPSEDIFDDSWAKLGKIAYVFKFTDAAEANGMNRKRVKIKAQPADRLLTYQGVTIYAEIKSTIDEARFNFSLLRTSQGSYAAQVLAAGGAYDVFVHSLAYDRWYRVPYRHIRAVKATGKSSIPWFELQDFLWTFPTSTRT